MPASQNGEHLGDRLEFLETEFNQLVCTPLKIPNRYHAAQFLNVSNSSYYRIISGQVEPSARFVARTLLAIEEAAHQHKQLRKVRFDDIFRPSKATS